MRSACVRGWTEFESDHEFVMNLNFVFSKSKEFEFRFFQSQ